MTTREGEHPLVMAAIIMTCIGMLWGALLSAALIVVYVRPHQLAKGLVSENSAYVVWSGELLIAILFGATITIARAAARLLVLRTNRSTIAQ